MKIMKISLQLFLMILFNKTDAQAFTSLQNDKIFSCESAPTSSINDIGLIDYVRMQIPNEALTLNSGYSNSAKLLNAQVIKAVSSGKPELSAKENSVRLMMQSSCGISDTYITPYTVIGTSVSDILPKIQQFIEKNIQHKGYNIFGAHLLAFHHHRSVTLIFGRRSMELQPVPKQVSVSDNIAVSGSLLPGFRKPQLFITTPLGETIIQNLPVKNRSFSYPLHFEVSGKYMVQIKTSSDFGEETLVQTSLILKEKPGTKEPNIHDDNIFEPRKPKIQDNQNSRISELFYQKINDLRNQYHLPELVFHPKLKELAQLQSQKMSERNQLEHSSKSLRQRLRKSRLRVQRAGENIAQYSSLQQPSDIDEVLKQFLESPSHRMNLLDPDYQYVGISLKQSEKEPHDSHYISLVFAEMK